MSDSFRPAQLTFDTRKICDSIDRLTVAVGQIQNQEDQAALDRSLGQLQFLDRRLGRIARAFEQLDKETSTES